jgi:hypothetical protein
MSQASPDQPDLATYFQKFASFRTRSELLRHIRSRPDWAHLRDVQGRNPWTRAIDEKPSLALSNDLLGPRSLPHLLSPDHRGRTPWFYLLRDSIQQVRLDVHPVQFALFDLLLKALPSALDTDNRGLAIQWLLDVDDGDRWGRHHMEKSSSHFAIKLGDPGKPVSRTQRVPRASCSTWHY